MKRDSFISNFEMIREIMHLILRYGSLTSKHFDGISESKLQKVKPKIMALLQDQIEDRRINHSKKRSLHITSDLFSNGFSQLSNVYMLMSVKPDEIVLRLLILQILSEKHTASRSEIIEAISEQTNYFQDISENTFTHQLQHLTEYGQISCNKNAKTYFYSLAYPDFPWISDNVLQKLISYSSFMRNLIFPSICGEQLLRTLSSFTIHQVQTSYFLLKDMHLGHYLDDAILYKILHAIHDSRLIEFDYINQKKQRFRMKDILPIRTVYSPEIGRRFVFAINTYTPESYPSLFRLDLISNLKAGVICTSFSESEKDRLYQSAFQFSINGAHLPLERPYLIKLKYHTRIENYLVKTFPDIKIENSTEDYNYGCIRVNHPIELKSFLRKNAMDVQALPSIGCTLAEEMQKDAKLWRERYGISS